MSNDVTKTPKAPAPAAPAQDAGSRLKRGLMQDALGRMFGKETEKPPTPGVPRTLIAVANHESSPGWSYAKGLVQRMFDAAGVGGLLMKFACWGPDNAGGVRRLRVTKDWTGDPGRMTGLMDRSSCDCGCYIYIRSVLAQAAEENTDRTMRAMIIIGDAFHDSEESLHEAAIFANELRRAGTRLILIQHGGGPATRHKLEWLARVSGAVFLPFDPRTQERQFTEMWSAISAFAARGEEAMQATGGPAAPLLLEHFKQAPMPIVDEGVKAQEHVRANRDIKK